jgi:biofilm PGA synthesis N-glycosyltransferase PgaC
MILYLFWASVAIILYTYLGYGIFVGVWASLIDKNNTLLPFEPEVTLIIPAYNEASILDEKIQNCRNLDYPIHKLRILFITDGSTDNSSVILASHPDIIHLHIDHRGGKAVAENRAMQFVTTPYVVFTDCNTILNPEALSRLLIHYQDDSVGAVSGEKRILKDGSSAGSGEGIYWKYESFLKRCDSDIHSLMGAAGELISFRTELFQPLEADTILDDFIQSMRIVNAGYRVIYEPKAYASERPSFSLTEEMRRKVRICAGGWQSMTRLTSLLNPIKHPTVTFLYLSHRVLRWSITPLLLLVLIPLNAYLAYEYHGVYTLFFITQFLFYMASGAGWWLATHKKRIGPALVPLYFTMMNVAVFRGFSRFLRNNQPAAWEKAQRATSF